MFRTISKLMISSCMPSKIFCRFCSFSFILFSFPFLFLFFPFTYLQLLTFLL
jgi:hypothetical protein